MSNAYRILIIDTYYSEFLSSLYNKFPKLSKKIYTEQRDFIMDQCFGTADFYSKNLKKLGCEAEEIIPNNEILQKQWALEQGLKLGKTPLIKIISKIPKIKHLLPDLNQSLIILKEQIKKIKPDILYMQDLSFCPPDFLMDAKKYVKLIVGQIACPLPPLSHLMPYDLILTSFPHYVERFRSRGLKSELFKIAFESSILERVNKSTPIFDAVHVGGYGPIHNERNQLLETVAENIDIQFWGYGKDNLSVSSHILKNYHGESWGIGRYQIFTQSKIVITKHITSVAGEYCNNMTLYEATGCGALLVTDYKKNLSDIFIPDKEVVTYRSSDEAIQKIKYYLKHENERREIAKTGQKKTLRKHTYYKRMCELLDIIKKYM